MAFALEGTCSIGLRRLAKPLESPETEMTLPCGIPVQAPELPFAMTLKSFETDVQENGTPKQFTSTLEIDGKEYVTAVNHPCRYGKWRIYQYDYDGDCSVVKVVEHSPLGWIAAITALVAAIVFLICNCRPSGWRALSAAAVLTAGITAVSISGISMNSLPPALRSPFFVPHIMFYMVAYALLTVSLFSRRSARAASALLLAGLLLGSIWSKMAWCHFWEWDVKECWAAATWLLSAAACLQAKKGSRLCYLLLAFLAFAAMNMTWYGVNWLPGFSRHIY